MSNANEQDCEHLDIHCIKRRIGSGRCAHRGECIKADEIATKHELDQLRTLTEQQAKRIDEWQDTASGVKEIFSETEDPNKAISKAINLIDNAFGYLPSAIKLLSKSPDSTEGVG